MPDIALSVMAVSIAQAGAGIFVAILLLNFHRQYGRGYLLHWAWSWLFLSLFHLGNVVTILLETAIPPTHLSFTTLATISAVAGYLQIGYLIFGAYELGSKKIVPTDVSRATIAFLALMAATSVLFMGGMTSRAYLVSLIGRAVLSGLAFVLAGLGVWYSRGRGAGFGFKLIAGSFIIYGWNQLYFGVGSAWDVGLELFRYPVYLGLFDFALHALMGIGMVASLLDDEREAAVQATVEIEHLAYHDTLTGLPNRTLFLDRLAVALAQATRYEQKLAVLFLDVDRFKDINDSLGHTAGDTFLGLVTERLRRCVRQADTVARLGGDEFAILIQKIESFEDAAKVAQKVLETIKSPYSLREREIFASTSVGIAVFPEDGRDPETLLKNGETAMYRAKEEGRDNYQLFTPEMNRRVVERLALEERLRKAIKAEEFVVFYQPLVDLQTRRVTAFEALLRWQDPELGLLPPSRFIEAAEVSGLIIPLGAWVLRKACMQCKAWQKSAPGIGVSVNLSARQFQQPDLMSQVQEALQESRLNPEMLELEITETNAMQDADTSIRTLMELKNLGVQISMDDFGIGYSSLSYLKRFPIDILKLDQSFVRDVTSDPGDAAIATAVIAMAHSLSLKVVAEGVETLGQLTFLEDRLCDRFQGFYFSPPLSPTDFDQFLEGKRHLSWSLREADVEH